MSCESERSASVSNIVPDYVPTPSTVPIPDSVQPAQGNQLYSVANNSVERVSCQPSPSLYCRTIGDYCAEPPGSSLSLSAVPTVENGKRTFDDSHVDSVIATLPADLTADERSRAVQLITANADIFSKHEFDYGRSDLLEYSIDTADHKPIAQGMRRHPMAYLDLIDDTVNQLLRSKVIEPAASPSNFNVVLVVKPGNPIPRVTIDYRALNAITYKDHYPIPRIADCIDALSGSVFFSTLDLSGSFFQLGLKMSDRDKTAFSTRKGQWRFTTMPMGSCNSRSMFSRLMNLAIRKLTYFKCLVLLMTVSLSAGLVTNIWSFYTRSSIGSARPS